MIANLLRYILAVAVGFVIGLHFVHSPIHPTTTPRIDTLYVDKIVPYKTEVMKYKYIPKTQLVIVGDTVQVPIEKVVYKEKNFEATISGVSIGGIKPSIDNIVIHNEPKFIAPYATIMLGQNVFSLGGGVTFKEKHGLGVEYFNFMGNSALGIRYTRNF